MIEIGDLVKIKETSKTGRYPRPHPGDQGITGVVIGTTIDDQKDPEATDYWVRVVFLDGTKATLFHDETEILAKNESR